MTTGTPSRRRFGSLLLAALLVLPLFGTLLLMLWRMPYGWEAVGDLDNLENMPVAGFFDPRVTYFIPFFWLSLWSVWNGVSTASAALETYRVIHLATLSLLLIAFLAALAPRTRIEALIAAFAASVLIGSPAFRENLESLPLNHMVVVMVAGVLCWIIVERSYRWWHGPALVALAVTALGFKEYGLIVIGMILVAWACKAPGVRQPTAIALLAIALGYLGLRLATAQHWPVFAQSIGVGLEELSPDEAVARYGEFPLRIYVYNVFASAANMLFSEPTRGVFSISRDIVAGEVQPWQVNHLASSIVMTTLLLVWAAAQLRNPTAEGRERRLAVLLAVAVIGSAALGFNYSRDRGGGVAAVFYAVGSFFAVRWLVGFTAGATRRQAASAAGVILLLSAAWHLRAVGTIQEVRETGWSVRREWIIDLPERRREFADRPAYRAILEAMSEQGSDPRADAPREPRPLTRLLGDW